MFINQIITLFELLTIFNIYNFFSFKVWFTFAFGIKNFKGYGKRFKNIIDKSIKGYRCDE